MSTSSAAAPPAQPKRVPESIHFEADLLLVPTFEEAGIPRLLGELGQLKPEVKAGQWVDRGDVLLTATYSFYETDFRLKFLPNVRSHESFSLVSPVAGLVLDFRQESVALRSQFGSTYYTEQPVLPVLLLPKDEPPQDRWNLAFYGQIGRLLRRRWQSAQYDSGQRRNVALGKLLPELSQNPRWTAALERIAVFEDAAIERFTIRRMTAADTGHVATVQHLRSRDLVLRDKLVHLTQMG